MQTILPHKATYYRILINNRYFKSYGSPSRLGAAYTYTTYHINYALNSKQAHRVKWWWCLLSELEQLFRVTSIKYTDINIQLSTSAGESAIVNINEVINVDAFNKLCEFLQSTFLGQDYYDSNDKIFTPGYTFIKNNILCVTNSKDFYMKYNVIVLFKRTAYMNGSLNQQLYDSAKNVGVDCKKIKEMLKNNPFYPTLLIKSTEDLNLLKLSSEQNLEQVIMLDKFKELSNLIKVRTPVQLTENDLVVHYQDQI